MAGRKNPHNGFFGNPPSVNFFTSHDEDETEHEKNSDEELEEKIRMHHSAVNDAHNNGVLSESLLSFKKMENRRKKAVSNNFVYLFFFCDAKSWLTALWVYIAKMNNKSKNVLLLLKKYSTTFETQEFVSIQFITHLIFRICWFRNFW